MKKTIALWCLALALTACSSGEREAHLLNVSYDPTRELYVEPRLSISQFS